MGWPIGADPDGEAATELVSRLCRAIRDRDLVEMQAVTDRHVVCWPLVRPGLSLYYGHDGLALLSEDLHKVHGDYTLKVKSIEEIRPGTVVARALICPGAPVTAPTVSVRTTYRVLEGLITSVESEPGGV